MSLVYLDNDPNVAGTVETCLTLSNAMAIAVGSINELIGKDLAASDVFNFEDFIAVCIGNEINTAVEATKAVEGASQ